MMKGGMFNAQFSRFKGKRRTAETQGDWEGTEDRGFDGLLRLTGFS
jgi:hypothetical protein